MSFLTRRLAVFFLLLAHSAVAHAQGGTILGSVHDADGGVLPGVTVEAVSPASSEQSRLVVTDIAGRYNVGNLQPGTYSVTFRLPGFVTVARENVELNRQGTAVVNAKLAVGIDEKTRRSVSFTTDLTLIPFLECVFHPNGVVGSCRRSFTSGR